MMQRRWVVLAAVVVLFACTKARDKKFTDENSDKILKEIGESKDVTGEERELFLGYMVRHGIADAFAGKDVKVPAGRSFADIVSEQRAWLETERARAAREKALAAKAKAAEETKAKELRDTITVSVFEKGFVEKDIYAHDYDDKITLKVAYQNNSKRDLAAFKGIITFRDTFGDKIYSTGLKDDVGVKAGATRNVGLFVKYNQFIDADVRLKNADLAKTKVEFQPITVMFADGSSLGENAKVATQEE